MPKHPLAEIFGFKFDVAKATCARTPFQEWDLREKNGGSACKIDVVLMAYKDREKLTDSRKRLALQLLHEGGIVHAWVKKSAVSMEVSQC